VGNGKVIGIVVLAGLAALLVAFGPPPDRADDSNTLRMVSQAAPDSIDPAVSWMGLSWTMQVNVYNGLLTYRKESGDAGLEVVPDLAEALPEISADGRTYTFRVREGVAFGPPANRPVEASDVKYTFDRLAHLQTQGQKFFSVIEGFDETFEAKKGTVRGVVADDAARTVTFQLTRPDATFLYSLALPFSFTVPKGTAPEDLSLKERTAPTGPYMFTEYDPSRKVVLERNPAFKEWTEHTPAGAVDRIVVDLKVSPDNAVTRILQGRSDGMLDAIPVSKLPFLSTSKEWRPYYHVHSQARVSYLWMNTRAAPFDNVKVRQAVNWAINRRAMVKLGGGAGTPSSQILPPTIPGHTGFEPYPEQDLDKARALIKESGITPGEVTIWCMTNAPIPDMAQYVQEVLRQLGFKARTRCLDFSAYYNVVGNEKTKAQIGFGGWGADYPEGSSFFYSLLYGGKIDPNNSSNLAWYTGHDEDIGRVMAMMDLDERAREWGRIDREIVQDAAAWAPISHGVKRVLLSRRVGEYRFHPLYDLVMSRATVDGTGTNHSETHVFEVGYDAEGNPVEPGEEAADEEGGDA
jgi:peptide/nickel transport system substrate-binding protein